jgi:hypothetical protein
MFQKRYWTLIIMAPIFTFIMSLVACGNIAIKPSVVIETKNNYIPIPEELIADCSITAPPYKTEYMAAGEKGKEDLLVNYGISLNKDLRICNNQLDKVRQFQTETLENLKK